MAITERSNALVVGRAGERPVEPLRRLLRRRLGPAAGAAAQHGAAARSWATTTAGCWRRASCSSCARRRPLRDPLPRAPHAGGAALARRRCSPAAARRCGSTELAFIADALGQLPARHRHRPRRASPRRHRDKEVLARPAGPALRRAARGGRGASTRRSPRSTPTPTGSTRCSSARTTGWPSGAPPARSSTTGASSTSTPWSACAWRTSGSSPTPTRWSSAGCATGVLDGLRIDHPDGLRDPERVLRAAARRRARRPGSWSRRSSSRASALPRVLAGRRDHRLRLPEPRRRPVRRSGRRGAADRALRRASPARRADWHDDGAREEAAGPGRAAGERRQPAGRALPRRSASATAATATTPATSCAQALARGGRLLPRLPHLRAGRDRARSASEDRALRRRGDRGRAGAAGPTSTADLFDFFRDVLLLRGPRRRSRASW